MQETDRELEARIELLGNELREALEIQAAMADVLKIISRSSFDLDTVLTTVVRSAIDLCQATRGVIWLFRGEHLYLAAHVNYPKAWVKFAQDLAITPSADAVTISGISAFTGEILNVEDVLSDPRFRSLSAHQLGDYRGGLAVPLKRDGKVIGTISLSRPEARLFTERQVALVQTFADQAVIAIENARLFGELATRNREVSEALEQQQATGEVLRVIAASPNNLQPVLTAVAASAARLCDAYDVVIRLRKDDSLVLAAHFGPISVDVATWALERERVASRCVIDAATLHIADLTAAGDDFALARATAVDHGIRTILATPLLREGKAVGTIVLRRAEVKPFSEKQIELLRIFADQAVIAIENARLFAELEARNREILSRYFSPNLARKLAGGVDEIDLAGQRREVAALFTDIEGFTSLVETIEPDTLSELLNGYLAGMTFIVFSHEGTVTKIVGDAVHVLFGAPGDQPDRAVRAVACAFDLDGFAQTFREKWREKGVVLGATRIGVNAGPAIVGNFGGGRFFDYTAYGDTINIAARLETANKQLGTRICVSESVAGQVPDFRGRPVGDLVLRGKTEPLRAYEPLLPNQYSDPSTDGYLKAFPKLETGDPGALGAFASLVGQRPDDRLASFHLKRLLNGTTGTRIQMD
jgi:class 3 adenylate cyclase